jgi:zinc D-Ala-D-Ala dipeptidase
MNRWLAIAIGMCWLLIEIGNPQANSRSTDVLTTPPTGWKELPQPSSEGNRPIELSFPYATKNNFVRTQLYTCARCFLRPEVAAAVQTAHKQLQRQGYGGLKLFDCYRPRPVQRKMWEILPDPRYVGNPDRGSDHNRGMAVDLTILDRSGKPLDLGTHFDEFSTKAHHSYRQLSPQVLKNRELLKRTMIKVGFRPLDTEWWHYAWNGSKAAIGDWVWNCNRS